MSINFIHPCIYASDITSEWFSAKDYNKNMFFDLETPLTEMHGISRFLPKFKKLGIQSVRDLLWHFPARYEDFSNVRPIADVIQNEEVTIHGTIEEIEGRRSFRRRMYVVEALIADESGEIRAVWFNQPYIKNILTPGKTVNLSGKIAMRDNELYLSNPTYEIVTNNLQPTTNNLQVTTKHTARIVPIYPETKGLTSKGIRYLVYPILKHLEKIPETLPNEILRGTKMPPLYTALSDIHFPKTIDDALAAKKRFAFEDLFFLQLHNVRERLKLAEEHAPPFKIDLSSVKQRIASLPFELTLSQKKSLWEILQDLEKPHPMNRLLQGDVGSGKTIVAAIAAIETSRNGYQTAFMAPTEILARQHYRAFPKFFGNFESGIALLTGSESKVFYGRNLETDIKKRTLTEHIAAGKIKIIIGTHALIQQGIAFHNLALVIVDEQHRFGVSQRAALAKNTHKNFVPNLLSMSATPIPRTLSLTLFGDLDLSLITELPKNRKPIITSVVPPAEREKIYAFIRDEIKHGRQAFVICPRIEKSTNNESVTNIRMSEWQNLEMKNVKEEYEKLSKKIFPDLKVAMLHGKLKPKEKEKIMSAFAKGTIDILVATSVIEVGVDIPNATIMMIEGSERFGLAQLYQFRGRVGRGEHQSYCFLFTDSTSRTTQGRLKSIVEAKNGFELAEKDLKLRGPGEFFGTSQTGIPDLAMKAIQNPELVKTARDAAITIIKNDPKFERHPLLLNRLEQFQQEVHFE